MNLARASNRLSSLDLRITMDQFIVEVLWYRVMIMEGSWCIHRHTHSSYEIHIIAQGRCQVKLDEGEFIVRKGDFYMTAPGIYHEQRSIDEKPLIEYSLNIDFTSESLNLDERINHDKSGLQKDYTETAAIINLFKSSPCKAYDFGPSSIGSIFEQALCEADEEKFGYYNRIQSLTQSLLVELGRILNEEQGQVIDNVPKKLKADADRFKMIRQYIQDNIHNKIQVSDLANHLHLSEKQMNRIVRSNTELSVKALIKGSKLAAAKRMLQKTNMSQKEIALSLGFTSEYYFNQFFKREEGDTPGSFRANIGNVRKY